MIFSRQKAFLPILIAVAAVFGYQVNGFSQISPNYGNTGFSSNNPNSSFSAPLQPTGTPIPQNAVSPGGYGVPANVPGQTYIAANPTGPVAQPQPQVQNVQPQQNYMINRPLGAVSNTPVQDGTQPPMTQPGQTPNNQPLVVQNGRQIVPPPKGYSPPPEELAYISDFLSKWQEQSKNIEVINYDFTRLKRTAHGLTEAYGRVKYQAPDKGLFEIHSALIDNKKVTETGDKERYVCTGDAVYQFDFAEKRLTEFLIPQEQRGKGTLDSPLMVLVGANPQELQNRFYLIALNPWSNEVANCYCFRAWPKWPEDRDFTSVELAIDNKSFHAKELRVFKPGGTDYEVYKITKTEKNLFGQIGQIFAKDDFDRGTIVKSKPRDWAFETKTDFLPEASGQQYAQQPNPAAARPNPQYGHAVNNVPNNPTVPGSGMSVPVVQPQPQPNIPQNVSPNQTQLSQNGTYVANSGATNGYQYGTPQPYQTAPASNNSVPQPNQYMAMPPQNNTLSPSTIR